MLNHTSKQTNDPSTISAPDFAQEAYFDLDERDSCLRLDQNLELRIGFAKESALPRLRRGLNTYDTS